MDWTIKSKISSNINKNLIKLATKLLLSDLMININKKYK